MKKRTFYFKLLPAEVILAGLLLLLSGCGKDRPVIDLNTGPASGNAVSSRRETPDGLLRVAIGAMISPEITRKYYNELFQIISLELNREVEILQRRTYDEVNSLLKNNQADIAFVCSGAYIRGQKDFNMELLVVPVVNGETVYYSYITTGKDNEINNFSDLRGRRFAFTDPESNTGKLVPSYMLALLNETPESYFSDFFYTYSHDNSIKAVAEGLADGAAVDSLIWEFMNRVEPFYTSRTRIIEKSNPYGIPPVVINPYLDPGLRADLKEVFLSIHLNTAAEPLMKQIHIDRFEEGCDSMYDSVREMHDWVQKNRAGEQS